eukprot:jgi/Galph1/1765/GphlegSOOS_G454.1
MKQDYLFIGNQLYDSKRVQFQHSYYKTVDIEEVAREWHASGIVRRRFDQDPSVWKTTGKRSKFTKEYFLRKPRQKVFPIVCSQSTRQSTDETETKPVRLNQLLRRLRVLWSFTRPHTFIGTFISITSLTILANNYVSLFLLSLSRKLSTCTSLGNSATVRLLQRLLKISNASTLAQDINLTFPTNITTTFYAFLTALIPALLINVYIVGLNQIFDIKIDEINKPYLPLASKELSVETGWFIVILCGVLGLVLGVLLPNTTLPLNWTLIGSSFLGSLYSSPPFRLKQYPLLASFCILVVRGLLAFFQHARLASGFGSSISLSCYFYSILFVFFGIAIALMKDVPDVKGDRIFQIHSFSVVVGPQRVFRWAVSLLATAFFLSSFALFFIVRITLCKWILIFSHAAFAILLLTKSVKVDPEDPKQVYKYYIFLWKLFYFVYILVPLAG